MDEVSATAQPPRCRKWSRIGQIAKGAAIAEANRERATRRYPRRLWTAVEMKAVLDLYPDYTAIQERLPKRTYKQIRDFAEAYGIASKKHVWTNRDITKLREVARAAQTGSEIYAAFPDFTNSQVRSAAKTHRIPWPVLKPKILGVPVLDEVRQRAFGMNLSLVDLDEIAGGGQYFRKSNRYLDAKKLAAVVAFMGGQITVVWPDAGAIDADKVHP